MPSGVDWMLYQKMIQCWKLFLELESYRNAPVHTSGSTKDEYYWRSSPSAYKTTAIKSQYNLASFGQIFGQKKKEKVFFGHHAVYHHMAKDLGMTLRYLHTDELEEVTIEKGDFVVLTVGDAYTTSKRGYRLLKALLARVMPLEHPFILKLPKEDIPGLSYFTKGEISKHGEFIKTEQIKTGIPSMGGSMLFAEQFILSIADVKDTDIQELSAILASESEDFLAYLAHSRFDVGDNRAIIISCIRHSYTQFISQLKPEVVKVFDKMIEEHVIPKLVIVDLKHIDEAFATYSHLVHAFFDQELMLTPALDIESVVKKQLGRFDDIIQSAYVYPYAMSVLSDLLRHYVPNPDISVITTNQRYFETHKLLLAAPEDAKVAKVVKKKPAVIECDLLKLDGDETIVADVLLTELHPCNPESKDQLPQDVVGVVRKLIARKQALGQDKPLVAIIDISMDIFSDIVLRRTTEELAEYVRNGDLSLHYVQSTAKLIQLGADAVAGGLYIGFRSDFRPDMAGCERYMVKKQEAYIAWILDQYSEYLAEYARVIRENNHRMYLGFRDSREPSLFKVMHNLDAESAYISVGVNMPILEEEKTLKYLKFLLYSFLNIRRRNSFGFSIANITDTPEVLRVSVGLEEVSDCQALIDGINAFGQLLHVFKSEGIAVNRGHMLFIYLGLVDLLYLKENNQILVPLYQLAAQVNAFKPEELALQIELLRSSAEVYNHKASSRIDIEAILSRIDITQLSRTATTQEEADKILNSILNSIYDIVYNTIIKIMLSREEVGLVSRPLVLCLNQIAKLLPHGTKLKFEDTASLLASVIWAIKKANSPDIPESQYICVNEYCDILGPLMQYQALLAFDGEAFYIDNSMVPDSFAGPIQIPMEYNSLINLYLRYRNEETDRGSLLNEIEIGVEGGTFGGIKLPYEFLYVHQKLEMFLPQYDDEKIRFSFVQLHPKIKLNINFDLKVDGRVYPQNKVYIKREETGDRWIQVTALSGEEKQGLYQDYCRKQLSFRRTAKGIGLLVGSPRIDNYARFLDDIENKSVHDLLAMVKIKHFEGMLYTQDSSEAFIYECCNLYPWHQLTADEIIRFLDDKKEAHQFAIDKMIDDFFENPANMRQNTLPLINRLIYTKYLSEHQISSRGFWQNATRRFSEYADEKKQQVVQWMKVFHQDFFYTNNVDVVAIEMFAINGDLNRYVITLGEEIRRLFVQNTPEELVGIIPRLLFEYVNYDHFRQQAGFLLAKIRGLSLELKTRAVTNRRELFFGDRSLFDPTDGEGYMLSTANKPHVEEFLTLTGLYDEAMKCDFWQSYSQSP